ncbi:hypothetical protein DVH05_000521 [Phytophthora capsici]|nr:hypothetical protein DVH05_000521 [Phytophthora capsici]
MTQTPVAEAIGGIQLGFQELGELESAGRLVLQDFMAATLEHGPGQDIPITHSEPGDLEDTVEMQAGVLSVTGWVERSRAVSLFGGSTMSALQKNTGLISYGFHLTISPWNQTASHTHDEE